MKRNNANIFKINYSIKVSRSKIHGLGVFAMKNIPPKKKIGSMAGEIISKKEVYQKINNSKVDSIAIVELWNGKAIDASRNGNELRYVNHSCFPNAYLRVCGFQVEFYTLREILKGEEVTCNYGETHHKGTKKCNCGQNNCKGVL